MAKDLAPPAAEDAGDLEARLRDLIAQGVRLRESGDYAAALARFRAAHELRAHDVAVTAALAFTLLQSGDLDDAAALCEVVLAADSAQVAALATLGATRLRQGRTQEAADLLGRAATLEPGSPHLQIEAAAPLEALGRRAEAAGLLYRTLARDPDHKATLLEMSRLTREGGDEAGALYFLRGAARAHPGDAPLQRRLAEVLAEVGLLDDAEAAHRAAIAAAPQDPYGHLELGLLQRSRGDEAGALQSFRAAADLRPGEPGFLGQVAYSLLVIGRLEEAQGAYDRVLHIDPDNIGALHGLADIARRREDHELAVRILRRILAVSPDDLGARMDLGAAQRNLGAVSEAIVTFQAALAQAPDNADAVLELAMLRRGRGEHEAALALFLRLAKTRFETGMTEAASEYRALGRGQLAREALGEVLAVSPDDDLALLRLAELEVAEGEAEVALQACAAAIAAHPHAPAPYGLKASLLVQLGRVDDARALMETLRRTTPSSPDAEAVRLSVARALHEHDLTGALIDESTETSRKSFALWWERTAALIDLGRCDEAEAALTGAPSRGVFETSRAALLAARCADAAWQSEIAIERFDEALRLYAGTPEAHEQLARLWCLRGRVDEAGRHLRRLLEQDAYARLTRGQSLTPSQTLCGQLLNELFLDPGAPARLEALAILAPEARVPALLESIRSSPDFTPPALMLALALRQSGALEPPQAPRGAGPIPRRIIQYRGPEALGALREQATATWAARHPDYAYRCFDDTGAQMFLRRHFPPKMLDAYHASPSLEHAGHIFRYAYLSREGGVFVDLDARCVGSLEDVLWPESRFVAFQEPYANVGTTVLACGPGEPIIERALSLAVESVARGDNDIPWLCVGPGLLTRAFAQNLAERQAAWREGLFGRTILEPAQLYRLAAP